jgi:drug/metabolite transporter (DMT)-like permease
VHRVEQPASDARIGVALVAGAAVAWSTAGYFTRSIAMSVWPLLVWRNVFGGAFVLAYALATERGAALAALRGLDRIGWLGVVLNGVSMICYLGALRHTSVTNVVVIFASAPFVAALLSWLALGEAPARRTLVAAAIALAGVALTVAGTPGGSRGLTGDGLAVLMTLGLAGYTVILRHRAATSMVAASGLSAWVGALLALPFAAPSLAVTAHELLDVALFGVTSFGLGLALYTSGGRRLNPARTALVSTLDTPLAPLWVWLAFGEVPSVAAVMGGCLVLAAVAADTLTGRVRPDATTTTS